MEEVKAALYKSHPLLTAWEDNVFQGSLKDMTQHELYVEMMKVITTVRFVLASNPSNQNVVQLRAGAKQRLETIEAAQEAVKDADKRPPPPIYTDLKRWIVEGTKVDVVPEKPVMQEDEVLVSPSTFSPDTVLRSLTGSLQQVCDRLKHSIQERLSKLPAPEVLAGRAPDSSPSIANYFIRVYGIDGCPFVSRARAHWEDTLELLQVNIQRPAGSPVMYKEYLRSDRDTHHFAADVMLQELRLQQGMDTASGLAAWGDRELDWSGGSPTIVVGDPAHGTPILVGGSVDWERFCRPDKDAPIGKALVAHGFWNDNE